MNRTIVTFVSLILFASCSLPEGIDNSPEDIEKHFQAKKIKPDERTLIIDKQKIHFVATGDNKDRIVVFVHGSPGSWDAYLRFLTDTDLLAQAKLISVDRPGYEKSQGEAELSLQRQAYLLMQALQKSYPEKKYLLVGHSFGGPVIARMAMDYPEQVSHLVLVAASIDPELEVVRWYQKFADWTIIRWILPHSLDVCNQEILPLKQELQKMLPLWKNIRIPVTVIQGEKDTLVPPGNATFAKKMLINTAKVDMIVKKEMNHFVPWEHPELIKTAVLGYLSEVHTKEKQ
ncbi:MAG: alpha/beta hydrolase [Spirochaetota bacterium]